MHTLPKKEFKKKEVVQLLKEQRELCGKAYWGFLENDPERKSEIYDAVLNASEPEFPAGKTFIGLGYEKGGTALNKEMLDDIAWDIAISHKFIEGDKWKSDDMKTKAYKMAELEMIKYGKGGKAKAVSNGDGGIDWLITGSK